MMDQGSEMQVMYLEVEGIKIAVRLAKDTLRIAWQFIKYLKCSASDAKYKKTVGSTNIKNLKARANGSSLVPSTMDKKTFAEFKKTAKKYGVLFTAFHPLGSGKKGSVEVLIAEKDLPMMEEILSRIKDKRVRENTKCGMEEEAAAKEFDENNRVETMEEFAENVGVVVPKEVFEAKMKERFGENYEEMTDPKAQAAGFDEEKVNDLADVINFNERERKLKKDNMVEVQFTYDERHGLGQIVGETETHVKIEGKGLAGEKDKWSCLWIPKNAVLPPLEKDAEEQGKRTAYLEPDTEVVVEDPAGKTASSPTKAGQLYQSEPAETAAVAEETGYRTSSGVMEIGRHPITVSKTLIKDKMETEDAILTRVPYTWGENERCLWLQKKDITDVYGEKSMLTHLSSAKNYDLCDPTGKFIERINGEELYRRHYDPVENANRLKATVKAGKGKGRQL